VADKPVAQPREFAAPMRRGRPVVIGRADPAADLAVDCDLSEVASSASVSRTHAVLRFHAGRAAWQIRSCGRNGLFDERGRFYPPLDEWIDLAHFPGGRFEVGWVRFEIRPK
jgi:hypothetical protein